MEKLTVNYEGKPCYDVIINDTFDDFPTDIIKESAKVCIITDDNVASNCLDQVRGIFKNEVLVYCISPGEKNKNLDTVRDIYGFLVKNDLTSVEKFFHNLKAESKTAALKLYFKFNAAVFYNAV